MLSSFSFKETLWAYYDDTKASNAVAVYQFKIVNEEWTPYNKFLASDGKANDQFVYSLAISRDGRLLAVGARNAKNSVSSAGVIYAFS